MKTAPEAFHMKGRGAKILPIKQMLQRLPILLKIWWVRFDKFSTHCIEQKQIKKK